MGSDPEIIVTSLAEISSLREQLQEKEREMQEMTKSWQERLQKSEETKMQEAKSLEVMHDVSVCLFPRLKSGAHDVKKSIRSSWCCVNSLQ